MLLSNGSGGFQAPVQIIGPDGVTWVAGADLNKDGKIDLVASERDKELTLVLQGDGLGGFAPPVTYITAEIRNFFEVVDLNSDGRLDIVGPRDDEPSIFVMLNTCASATTADLSVSILGPTSAAAGDPATYTIRVTNNGPSTATNIRAVPTATAGFDFVGTSCTMINEFECSVASISPGGSFDFTFDLIVLSGVQTVFASATAVEGDPDPSNNFASLTTNVAVGPINLVVTNTDPGFDTGTLAHAIETSNNNVGPTNTITFAIPGPGPFTITPGNNFPSITNPVVIDGWSQGVFMGTPGYSGPPLIEISGALGGNSGFSINTGGTTIRGFVIDGFTSGSGIFISSGTGNVIQGNYLGTDRAGTAASANAVGIAVNGPNTLVGGSTAAARNVISGNTNTGVFIGGLTTNGVVTSSGQNSTVSGNYIGLDKNGVGRIANTNGIVVQAANAMIGGPTAASRNVITGNTSNSVLINNFVQNNRGEDRWQRHAGAEQLHRPDCRRVGGGCWCQRHGQRCPGTGGECANRVAGRWQYHLRQLQRDPCRRGDPDEYQHDAADDADEPQDSEQPHRHQRGRHGERPEYSRRGRARWRRADRRHASQRRQPDLGEHPGWRQRRRHQVRLPAELGCRSSCPPRPAPWFRAT